MTASTDDRTSTRGAPRLSALVVARNEEARIAECLRRLSFADETVVLLDRSTDRTAEIARGLGARVAEGAWALEPERRNAGIDACTGDWILEVDADEWATPALAAEIRAAVAGAKDGYFIVPMANHVGGRLVRHGWGAYNGVAAKPVLFRKGMKRWGRGRVHPRIALEGARQALKEPLLHFVYRDVSDMIERLNRYTDLAALDALEGGAVPPLGASLRRMASRAWKSYVARRGYREGSYGVALALFSALYPMLIHLKAAIPRDAGEPPSAGAAAPR
jgi:glycosyltransferase involved in cell wall biosynthesis